MEKIKSFKFSNLLNMIKCCLIGLLVTLLGIVILAVILKFADLSSSVIGYANNIIKAVAIFIMIACVKKVGEEKLLLKAVFAGILYAVLSFVIFSILNGRFSFGLGFVYDMLFAVIVAVLSSIILNILKRKSI